MKDFLPTLILRHRKENLKKCSLSGLEGRCDLHFLTYPRDPIPPCDDYLLLSFDGPELTEADKNRGIFLVDGTWRYSEVMERQLPPLEKRSLPKELQTSYPRKQEDCSDPSRGLASVEALYIALLILKRDVTGILDHYYWKEDFLLKNADLIKRLSR